MQLVIVGVALEVRYGLLPVRREDVLVLPIKPLMDLFGWLLVRQLRELKGTWDK